MHRVLKSLLFGGLIAGTVDIFAASLINFISPLIILRAIASGLLGRPAFHGGGGVVVLGLFLQWGMSIIIAAVFTLAADKFPALARRWALSGALYGVIVYVVMTFIVVPLSAAHSGALSVRSVVENLLAMLVFGWIVAFTTNRFLTPTVFRLR